MQNNSYFSHLNTIKAMASQTFVNKKLEFVEELVRFTDSNIFLTGKAGTGKTTFLRNLQSKTFKRIIVLAPTGVAAINAGGQTIHSFFQLPFGPNFPKMLVPTLGGKTPKPAPWPRNTRKSGRTKST